ncbi:MAG: V-type ATPase subunit [Clostridia bacterium]|nr:V-type ATPase subunit [Clostridia bacterium]
MTDAGLLYQNAIVKSRESTLLGGDRLQRIADAADTAEAVRLLVEAGYPTAGSPDEMLFAAEKEAASFFRSCMTTGYGLELFLVADDYHNAKVAAKSHFFGGAKDAYKVEGFLPVALIEESLEKEEYKALPTPMAEALAALAALRAKEELYPSDADVLLDKAAFAEISSRVKKAHRTIRAYFTLLADLKNISVAYRAGKASLSKEKTRAMLLPLGTLREKDLLLIRDLGVDAAEKIRPNATLIGALDAIKEGITVYEVYADDALLALLRKERYDMFSPAPVAGFYVGKQREILNVRLLLARIANGADKEIVKKRMRSLYV